MHLIYDLKGRKSMPDNTGAKQKMSHTLKKHRRAEKVLTTSISPYNCSNGINQCLTQLRSFEHAPGDSLHRCTVPVKQMKNLIE